VRALGRNALGLVQLATQAHGCCGEIPLSRMCVLSIEERLVAGDVRAIRDAASEFLADLEVWLSDYDAAVGDDPDARSRIDAVRVAKERRGELKFDPVIAGDRGDGSQREGAAKEPRRKEGARGSRTTCGRR
jgi:hypothetical protein